MAISAFVDFDRFDEVFDTEVAECDHLLVAEAVDPDDAVEKIDTLAETFGDASIVVT